MSTNKPIPRIILETIVAMIDGNPDLDDKDITVFEFAPDGSLPISIDGKRFIVTVTEG